jgi:hypothetical protein
VGTLSVSRRTNGLNYIMDGQHRQAVLILRGEEDALMDCHVHTGLTLPEEAEMFRLLNNAKAPSVLERFLVRIQALDPVAVDIADALDKKGWRIASAKTDGVFSAVASIEDPYTKAERAEQGSGRKVVDWIIGVCVEAFGRDSNGVRGEIIGGLGHLYLRYGDMIDTPKLVQQMGTKGPKTLIADARGLKEYRGGTVHDAMAEHYVGLINKGRHVSKWLPDWRTPRG